ncbi:MAG: hypothetical protein ACI9IV_001159 [Paracoccaceae bacterium]
MGVGVRMFSGLVKDHIILIIKNITYKKARFERGHLNDLINEVARLVCDKQQTSDRAMVIIQTALFFRLLYWASYLFATYKIFDQRYAQIKKPWTCQYSN